MGGGSQISRLGLVYPEYMRLRRILRRHMRDKAVNNKWLVGRISVSELCGQHCTDVGRVDVNTILTTVVKCNHTSPRHNVNQHTLLPFGAARVNSDPTARQDRKVAP